MATRSGDKPPRALRPTKYIIRDGELLALVTTKKGEPLTLDGLLWAFLVGPLEINPNAARRSNGHGGFFAKINALFPRPGVGGKVPTHDLARLVMALHLILEAGGPGKGARREGWSVEFKNGDHTDLRLANLRLVEDPRATYHAIWDLERRLERIAEGLPITAEFKARKRNGDPGNPSSHEREV